MSDRTAAIRDLTEAIEHAEKMRVSLERATDSLWGVDHKTGLTMSDQVAYLSAIIGTMRQTLRGLQDAR